MSNRTLPECEKAVLKEEVKKNTLGDKCENKRSERR
jgi:hypothetical protein